MRYLPTNVAVSPEGRKRLETAIKKRYKNITLFLTLDTTSDKVVLLSRKQIKQLENSPGKIKFTTRQLEANIKHTGGFLFTLAAILAAAIPSVITAVAAGAIERAVAGSGLWLKKVGNGLYLRRRGSHAVVERHGNEIHLIPTDHFPEVHGEGLFLVKDGQIYQPTEYENQLNILY